jgi:hypothetical protein
MACVDVHGEPYLLRTLDIPTIDQETHVKRPPPTLMHLTQEQLKDYHFLTKHKRFSKKEALMIIENQ